MKQSQLLKACFFSCISFFLLLLMFISLSPAVMANSIIASSATLPFDMLSYATFSANPRMVFAHYHTAYPISIDNLNPTTDYYARNYLNPYGENSKYLAQGGLLRDRPVPRAASSLPKWKLHDMRKEVKLAKAIGLDGFTVNILNFEGVHLERTKLLLEAAQIEGNFHIVLMPDMSAALRQQPDRISGLIEELSRYPAAMRLADGRLVVSPYMAQLQTPEWWAGKLAAWKRRGINVAFVPLFHNWLNHYKAYASLSYGVSDWGPRTTSTATVSYWTKMADKAHAAGLKWMAPVVPQDMRPKSYTYWEASNSEMYRKQWWSAINGQADWVQIITWNDYSEHSAIGPGVATGYAFYDLTAYYITWFKTGVQPPIKRDAIYSFYRTHPSNARPDPTKQSTLVKPASNSDVPLDRIEMLAFLTAPATLEISLDGEIHRQSADAGITSFTIPLQAGTPSFRIVRNGDVVESLYGKTIKSYIAIQDLLYHGESSLR